jgi:hypothetical protein
MTKIGVQFSRSITEDLGEKEAVLSGMILTGKKIVGEEW